MPVYEFYCERCNGIFEAFRQMRDASLPAPCPECNRGAERIMSAFTAFTMRDGYPRRIPDKGTYWHLGKEVKKRAKRMKGWEHPELATPKPKTRPGKGETDAARDKRVAEVREARYRDRWGIDQHGFRTVKAKKAKPARKTIGP
jgi:putative FmdB family regulatory protein